MEPTLLDCTFRDGGYYNDWNFPEKIVQSYLSAAAVVGIDVVELGFRFLQNRGFKGPHAFTSDAFIQRLNVPSSLKIAVMVNASDLLTDKGPEASLETLFPVSAAESPIDIVRLACHYRHLEYLRPALTWLIDRGYSIGLNLMQISDRTDDEIRNFARLGDEFGLKVLYFADSTGSMAQGDAQHVVKVIREEWAGDIGVHAHDNLGLALQNTLAAHDSGARWLDATVTGMGRGPGNTRTEELVVEMEERVPRGSNFVPLFSLVRQWFEPLKKQCGWGTNCFYFLSGKYGIHPTYVQHMLDDVRYDDDDVIEVLNYLRGAGAKSFDVRALENAQSFSANDVLGNWAPRDVLSGREVMILGPGPSAEEHSSAVQRYIDKYDPVVLALNLAGGPLVDRIHYRVACHPIRLLADARAHQQSGCPLIAPVSMLATDIKTALADKNVLDFGMGVSSEVAEFGFTYCIVSKPMVLAYALGIAASGKATRISMVGFDGYHAGDPRNDIVDDILRQYSEAKFNVPFFSITPTRYKNLAALSVYAM